MSKHDEAVQTPGVQHLEEGSESGKNESHIIIPRERQSLIRRKFDRRVLPIVCLLFLVSYLDRGNIGNAYTAGLNTDLHLNNYEWSWVLYAFYICYILFEWTTVLWKLLPAHIYISGMVFCWGVSAVCTGAVNNIAGLVVCRCLLGVFEATFGAGAPFYLSLFYQREELGFRVSLLIGMSTIAGCFASALAYGITQIQSSLESWRLIFIIEGAPCFFLVPVVYFLLPDSPHTAKFLDETEQTEAVERLQTVDRTAKNKMHWRQTFNALWDYKNWAHTVNQFFCNYSFAGIFNFLPTIIENMGFSSIDAQGLSAPPYIAGFLCCLAAAIISDRWKCRGYVVTFFAGLGTVGYLILVLVQDNSKTGARYCGVMLATSGIFPAMCVNMTWLMNNQGGETQRGVGLAILAVFGQTSSFISSSVFPTDAAPFFTLGCALGCAFTGLVAVISLALHFGLAHENRRRDRVYGPVGEHHGRVDVTDGGNQNPKFRYLT